MKVGEIQALADELCRATRDHARICSTDSDDPTEIGPILAAIRHTARRFAVAVEARTGLDPFHEEQRDLEVVADIICDALHRIADASDAEDRIRPRTEAAVEVLRTAVNLYAQVLIQRTGRTNPFYKVGEIPPDDEIEEPPEPDTSGDEWVSVLASYHLRIHEPDDIIDFASVRLQTKISSLREAIELLCAADGWKPSNYPASMLSVDDQTVDADTE